LWIVTRRRAVITTTQALIIILAAFMVGVGVSLSGVLTTNNAGNRVGGTTQQNTSVNVTNPQQTIPTQNTTLPNKTNTSNSTTQKPANNKQTINYTLTVEAPDGKGTQNLEEGIHYYPANSTVQVYANSSLGWEFTYWTLDNQKEVGNPITVTMNAPHTLKAMFTETRYNLTITIEGSGTTDPVPGIHSYAKGADVTVNATAAEGWQFKCWTQNSENTTTNPIKISVNRDTELKATFIETSAQPAPVPPMPTPSSNYTLTVNTVGQGSVARNPSKASYSTGESIQLTATPATGYTFTGWSGDASGSSNPLTVSITGNMIITATFDLTQYTVTSSAGSGGSISPLGATQVTQGSTQAFTITANTGYLVSSVVVDGFSVGVVSSYTFSNVQADHTIAATFAQIQYTVTVNTSGQGTVAKSPSQSTYHYGDSVQLQATPSAGWVFSAWSGALTGSVNPSTLTVNGNMDVTASFTLTQFTITSSAGSGGSISPSGGVVVSYGSSQAFTISPSTGYQVSDVLVDGVSVGAVSSYTFSGVQVDHTLSATFAPIQFTITASAGSGGSISPSGSLVVNYGGSQSYTITANTGYSVSSVDVDGSSVGAVTSYQFSNVQDNHTITATFALLAQFTITSSAGSGGSISPLGATQVTQGGSQVYTISPSTGYQVSDVLVDGVSVEAVSSYTFSSVQDNHTIVASFTQTVCTLSIMVSPTDGGTVSTSISPPYHYGDVVTLTESPGADYTFSSWSGDGLGTDTTCTITIMGNMAVTATFTLN